LSSRGAWIDASFDRRYSRKGSTDATASYHRRSGDQVSARPRDAFQFWDLGEQWKNRTGLPFVYALWLIRPEVPNAKSIAERLRGLRDENRGEIPSIVSEAVADVGDDNQAITKDFLDCYYKEHLRFGFGTREKQGLQTFANLCAKHGVLLKKPSEFTLV
jgi:predicted solute-binding protein